MNNIDEMISNMKRSQRTYAVSISGKLLIDILKPGVTTIEIAKGTELPNDAVFDGIANHNEQGILAYFFSESTPCPPEEAYLPPELRIRKPRPKTVIRTSETT